MDKKVNYAHIPLFRDAGFNLKNSETTKAAFAEEIDHPHDPDKYIYSRYRNPTVVAVEKQIMRLEESKWALLSESGMAAIDIAVSLFHKGKETKPWVFFSEIYGGTNSFIDTVLIPRRGIEVHRFYAKDGAYHLDELDALLQKIQPGFIYFEAVSNPLLIVADVENILQLAKKYQVKVIVDNTFATPMLWKPLKDGADLVVHSATKYLSGHGNITAGVVCGNDIELMKEAIEYRKWTGHFFSPDDAYRLGTQLKSFEIRFQKHCENALKLAKYLEIHPAIEYVLYPGLESHSTNPYASRLFKGKGYGGMITFEFKGETSEQKGLKRDKFMQLVEDSIPLIPSLGDADTILIPVEPIWGHKYPLPGMIRLSVGIEDYEWLEQVVGDALKQL